MTAFYNEIDPYAAQWLRNLIAAGVVDERSIEDIRPEELVRYTQCHFFAGVGVWSYALRLAGWPDDRPIWTGSCPCQPFSSAGQGAGFADERHLWPAFYHLICECRPGVVVGEQVASKDADTWLDLVQTDMEALGHAFGAVAFPSAGVGAPHIRDRTYWVADSDGSGFGIGRRLGLHREGQAGPYVKHGGESCRLGDDEGLEERQRDGGFSGEPAGADQRQTFVGTGVCIGGLGHAQGERCGEAGPAGAGPTQRFANAGAVPSGLANSSDAGLQRRPGEESNGRDETRIELERLRNAVGVEHTEGDRWQQRRPEPSGRGVERRREPNELVVVDMDSGAWTGPTNGFWRDADWLFCRDGKWRPASPKPQPLVDGSAESMGRVCPGIIEEVEREINAWAVEAKISRAEAMRNLLEALRAESHACWSVGRIPGLHEAPFLLAFMRQLAQQGWAIAENSPLSCSEDVETELRMLRDDKPASGTPHKHGLAGQPTGEHTDTVHFLSSLLARHAHSSWDRAYQAYAETAHPLARSASSRIGRLRAYGNAINAQAAKAFIESLM